MEIITEGDRRRAQVDSIRAQRESLLTQIDTVQAARLTLDETTQRILANLTPQIELAKTYLRGYATPGSDPEVMIDPPELRNAGRSGRHKFPVALCLWLLDADLETLIRKRLKDDVAAAGLSLEERAKRVKDLRSKIAEIERHEEIEIRKLERAEFVVERRHGEIDVDMILEVWDSESA